jgi:RND family efflux transporter MFP subunit
MRKFWIISSISLAILLAAGLGVSMGAAYRDEIVAAMGFRPGHRKAATTGAADHSQAIASSGDHSRTSAKGKVFYQCGMHPWIIQDHPGLCPICQMPLSPMKAGAAPIEMGTGGPAVTIDPAVVQNMGVQTATVTRGNLTKTVRTVGSLEVPETGLYDITLKINGYIDKLDADTTGMHIHKGEPLFDVYSPELVAAEEELIAARKSVDATAAAGPEAKTQAAELLAAARRKLELWDIPDDQIDAVATLDQAPKDMTFRSPATGHLADKMIVQGSAVQAGMKLLRIEDHRTLWLEAKVFEEQLPVVAVGETADATFDAAPGQTFSGKIVFINPHLDHMNRTTDVRVVLDNADFHLKPGMYATVKIHTTPQQNVILVPDAAVIDTGTRKVVFVREAAGHFSPRLVTTGISGDHDEVEVLSGLSAGETVVTSGQFLMDVESRMPKPGVTTEPPAAPASTSQSPATTSATATRETARLAPAPTDDVVQTYLAIARYLQQDHADRKAADVRALIEASNALATSGAADIRPLARAVKAAAAAMDGQALDAQHKSFEKLGAAMVALIQKAPPSSQVAPTLYVVNCPMEKADWLQTEPTVHNPFLTDMRTCGSVTKTLTLVPAR